jgi:SAM-dependent methyltransferase
MQNTFAPVKSALQYPASLLTSVWTRANESALGIQTEPDGFSSRPVDPQEPYKGTHSESARHSDNFIYGTIGYRTIRRILRLVDPAPSDVFYDIGCGMGRILCVAAQNRMRKCIGVELLEPLCHIASRNAKNLRARKTPIEIMCGDATSADLSEGTIYFMFNPFGPQTLKDTLENIKHSLMDNPRTIKIVYYNSIHKSVIEGLDWLVKIYDLNRFGRHDITVWVSHPKPLDAS